MIMGELSIVQEGCPEKRFCPNQGEGARDNWKV